MSKIFALLVAAIAMIGCACPQPMKDAAATQRAVHDGYVRTILTGVKDASGKARPVTREELITMVVLDRKAWASADYYCNQGTQPDGSYDSLVTAMPSLNANTIEPSFAALQAALAASAPKPIAPPSPPAATPPPATAPPADGGK